MSQQPPPPPPPPPPPQEPGWSGGQPAYGMPAGPSGPRAGFWVRFAAAFIDGIIIGAVSFFPRVIDIYLGTLVQVALGFLYFGYFEGGPSGQTLGKKALDIRVTRFGDYGPLGWGTALLRHLCSYLSSLACGLGYFWMLWDREKMTWHDKLSNTVVVPATVVPPPLDSFGKPPVG